MLDYGEQWKRFEDFLRIFQVVQRRGLVGLHDGPYRTVSEVQVGWYMTLIWLVSSEATVRRAADKFNERQGVQGFRQQRGESKKKRGQDLCH